MALQLDKALAYVLHRRPYRDTSSLIEFFTQEYGRISVIAKGAKRAKSPLKSSLQLFQPLLIQARGKGELASLYRVDIAQPLPTLKADRLAWGFYLNELLYRLLKRHDEAPEIFSHYHQLLQKLTTEDSSPVDLRYFENQLLTYLGYGLPLYNLSETENYLFDPELGLKPTSLPVDHRKIFSGRALLALATQELIEPEHQQSAKQLLRQALQHLLGDKPLKSREMLR